MKLRPLVLATALALAAPFALAHDHTGTPDRTPAQVVADATITAAVKTALLADPRTEGFDIDVDTHAGKVTLTGGADTAADKAAATELAAKVSGVVSVDNRLVVAAEGTAARDAANTATASGAVRATVKDLDGDGVDEVGPGPDAEVDNFRDLDGDGVDEVGPGPDAELNNVQDLDGDGVDEVGPGPDAPVNDTVGRSADPVLSADDIDTDGQSVTDNDADLDGDVDADARIDGTADLNAGIGAGASAAARASGDETATAEGDGMYSDPTPRTLRDTDGDGVDEVGPGRDAPNDMALTGKVKAALLADAVVKGLMIDVDTRAGVVTLRGTVETQAQHDTALRLAAATAGVRQVVDDLVVGTP